MRSGGAAAVNLTLPMTGWVVSGKSALPSARGRTGTVLPTAGAVAWFVEGRAGRGVWRPVRIGNGRHL
jgi:hypothetical protein